MKTHFIDAELGRYLSIDPFNDGTEKFECVIEVSQEVNCSDLKWREAKVLWLSNGKTSTKQTKQFAEALLFATNTALFWTEQCAGKDCREAKPPLGAIGTQGYEGERYDNRGPQGPQEKP